MNDVNKQMIYARSTSHTTDVRIGRSFRMKKAQPMISIQVGTRQKTSGTRKGPALTTTTKRFLDEDFDLDVSWYTHDDLLNLAFDKKELSKLDQGDMRNLVRELALRLQQTADQLQRLER
jgi:hypothetical protein